MTKTVTYQVQIFRDEFSTQTVDGKEVEVYDGEHPYGDPFTIRAASREAACRIARGRAFVSGLQYQEAGSIDALLAEGGDDVIQKASSNFRFRVEAITSDGGCCEDYQ